MFCVVVEIVYCFKSFTVSLIQITRQGDFNLITKLGV